MNDPEDKTNFGYRAYDIVGWDVAPGDNPIEYWIMANTFSTNWGFSGYIRVQVNDPIIEGFYAFNPSK